MILESNRIESYSIMPIINVLSNSGGRLCSPLICSIRMKVGETIFGVILNSNSSLYFWGWGALIRNKSKEYYSTMVFLNLETLAKYNFSVIMWSWSKKVSEYFWEPFLIFWERSWSRELCLGNIAQRGHHKY